MEEILQEIITEIKDMKQMINGIGGRQETMEEQQDGMKKQMDGMQQQMNGMQQQMNGMQQQMDNMKEQQEGMKNQIEENTDILKSLEHKVDVNKAELSSIAVDTADIKGTQKRILEDIEDIKHDVNILAINTAKNSLDVAKLKGIIGK